MHAPFEAPFIPEDFEDTAIPGSLSVEERIRNRAYEYYERRGRVDGFDLEDWLAAEREILEDGRRE